MKSILFITSRPIVGGAQRWTVDQAKLMENNFNIYLSTAWEGWLSDSLKNVCKAMLIDRGLYTYNSFYYYFKLIKFIIKYKIDIVVASSASAGLYARILKIFFPKLHIIYVSHGWSSLYKGGRIAQYSERILSVLTSKILTVSQNDYEDALSKLKINKNKVVLIENGIYPSFNRDSRETNKKCTLLMVARFEYPKQQILLLEAAKKLTDIEVLFIGEGENLEKLRHLAPENVKFLGEQHDIYFFLDKADIFVLLSDSEGMPLSILEAMSMGKPLLLSNIKSLNTFISNNGLLVDNTVDDIIIKINTLKKLDYGLLGENSLKLFNKRYNILNKRESYLELYENFNYWKK